MYQLSPELGDSFDLTRGPGQITNCNPLSVSPSIEWV